MRDGVSRQMGPLMRTARTLLLVVLAAAVLAPAAAPAADKVDLLLVLAADVSRSVDSSKF
jgi:hypothetical protein